MCWTLKTDGIWVSVLGKKAFGRSIGLFIAKFKNCHPKVCIHEFLIGNNNLCLVHICLTSLDWQLSQWRIPFPLFPTECILGHWRLEERTMWTVVSKWFWLIWKLLAQIISRAPFLLQMSPATASNWSYLTMKLGNSSLFYSYPEGKKQIGKRFILLDSKFGKVRDVSRSSGLDVQRHCSAKLYMIRCLVPV